MSYPNDCPPPARNNDDHEGHHREYHPKCGIYPVDHTRLGVVQRVPMCNLHEDIQQ